MIARLGRTAFFGPETQLQLRVLATERSAAGTRVHVAGFGARAALPEKSDQ